MIRPALLPALSFLFLIAAPAAAQIEHGGVPFSISHAKALPDPIVERMPSIDLAALQAQDAINDQDKSIPWRFGFNHAVDLSIENSGTWTTLKDGTAIWRLAIECPGALSINFEFHEFDIPEGAKVFVMNDRGDRIGAFTRANMTPENMLGVQAMKGDRILIEYSVPSGADIGRLRIGQVTHGYRDVFKYARGLGDSGSCNNNVICAEFDPWRDQIRSVAIITVGGSGLCTGTLINNCAENGTPYFLTARHCLPGDDNVSTWVFRFNWESPSCTLNQNGPTNQTVSGASLLAQNAGTDMALLLLNSTPPSSYDVFYSGWDRSGNTPSSNVAIHHPSGDVKKISFDDDAAGQATYGGASCWRIFNWEDGTTEPGSSGSGLWDQNKRLIGQLYGGEAHCGNNVNDYYGRFDLSYPLIQSWLGSCGNTLDGYDPNAPSLTLDAQLQSISGVDGTSCNEQITPTITVRNAGLNTITSFNLQWSISGGNNGSQNWTGSLTSGNSIDVVLAPITLPVGTSTFTATVASPNGGTDQAPANNSASAEAIYGNNNVTLQLILDRYGNETTWEIVQGTDVLASGGPYTQSAVNGEYPQAPIAVCLADGCYELRVYDEWGDGMCCGYGDGGFTLIDENANVLATGGSFTYSSFHTFCVEQPQVLLSAKVRLEGPYSSGTQLMMDALRSNGYVPLLEPYTALGFIATGGGGETISSATLNTVGSNAIVDWIHVELRGGSPGYNVIASRNALLQRDGDIVDLDGTSPLEFDVAAGNYHIAVRHRNHLGIMTAASIALSSTTTVIDMSSGGTAIYGTGARKNISGIHVMWAGNVVNDASVRYTGSANDRDPILVQIGGTVPTNSVGGYHSADVNMDGQVRYTGASNDRDPILQNIGGTIPTSTRAQQLP